MNKLTPNLMVADVKETVGFYCDELGFELVMAAPESQDEILQEIPADKTIVFAIVKNGTVEIMIQQEESFKQDLPALQDVAIGASICLYIEMKNLEQFYQKIKDSVEVVKDFTATWYGMNEFYIRDNSGYIIGFGEENK